MEISNGKNWTTEKQKTFNISNSTLRPGSLGEPQNASAQHGIESIEPGRKDCEWGYPSFGGSGSSEGITGKILDALIEETQRQRDYHRQQFEVLELRLKELKQTSESIENTK